MVDATSTAAKGRPSATSFISFGHKRMPSVGGYLFAAGIFDILGMIPIVGWFLGMCFMWSCIGIWWLNDYKIDFSGAKMLGVVLVRFIPFPIPALMWFVWRNYETNKIETEPIPDKEGNVKKSKTERIASFAMRYASGKKAPEIKESAKPDDKKGSAETRAEHRGVSYEQKGTTGNGVIAPTSAADKNIGYRQRNIDGIAPAPQAQDNSVGYSEAA